MKHTPEKTALLNRIYAQGYHAGHHDTVEGQYVDVLPVYMDTYHADAVSQIIEEDTANECTQNVVRLWTS